MCCLGDIIISLSHSYSCPAASSMILYHNLSATLSSRSRSCLLSYLISNMRQARSEIYVSVLFKWVVLLLLRAALRLRIYRWVYRYIIVRSLLLAVSCILFFADLVFWYTCLVAHTHEYNNNNISRRYALRMSSIVELRNDIAVRPSLALVIPLCRLRLRSL